MWYDVKSHNYCCSSVGDVLVTVTKTKTIASS